MIKLTDDIEDCFEKSLLTVVFVYRTTQLMILHGKGVQPAAFSAKICAPWKDEDVTCGSHPQIEFLGRHL